MEYYNIKTGSYDVANLRDSGEVIVTAGTIRSPHFLLSSGIGPAAQLEEFNIPVVADVPGVGKTVDDHLAISMLLSCKSSYSSPTTSISGWEEFF